MKISEEIFQFNKLAKKDRLKMSKKYGAVKRHTEFLEVEKI